mmetsp:Transcript_13230/g.23714  ORF Transcript_13230/g.23714 Transcript_13230/m.23714 type:complete len:115 (+) Transcript_13230:147-491(+)
MIFFVVGSCRLAVSIILFSDAYTMAAKTLLHIVVLKKLCIVFAASVCVMARCCLSRSIFSVSDSDSMLTLIITSTCSTSKNPVDGSSVLFSVTFPLGSAHFLFVLSVENSSMRA